MGKVATVFKVYIENGREAEVSKEIKETLKPNGLQVEEVAFGIKVLKVMFIHEDEEGSTSFEENLRKIKDVTEVEIDGESLL
jgi:translation elongation factor EF-1beta